MSTAEILELLRHRLASALQAVTEGPELEKDHRRLFWIVESDIVEALRWLDVLATKVREVEK